MTVILKWKISANMVSFPFQDSNRTHMEVLHSLSQVSECLSYYILLQFNTVHSLFGGQNSLCYSEESDQHTVVHCSVSLI